MTEQSPLKKTRKKLTVGLIFGLTGLVIICCLFSCNDVFKESLPIKVSYRNSALGKGYVIIMENKSNKHIGFKLSMYNDTANQQKEVLITIAPHSIREFGWLEGWKFVSGERFELYCKGYKTSKHKIP